MTQQTDPSDDEEYSGSSHQEKYGLDQHQMGLHPSVSISWSGSAYDLIRDEVLTDWQNCEPRGCALRCFERMKTGVKVRTFPEMKSLWQAITDELNRRRINKRQRNSLHRVRDELEDAFEDRREGLTERAKEHYNGHQFRAKGEIPSASVAASDVRLDAPVEQQEFIRGRVKRHLGLGPAHRHDESEIEKVVNEIPLMYGYAVDE